MYPIKTFVKDNTVVKVCVEDAHRLINAVHLIAKDAYSKTLDLVGGFYSDKYDGYYIETKGKAVCGNDDNFDEEIGNEIAFRKMKIAANIRKVHLIRGAIRVLESQIKQLYVLLDKFERFIEKDSEALKAHNPKSTVTV